MLTGKLWLDYEDDDEEAHFEANVTRAIFREDEIVLEFLGHDPDNGAFSGHCKLTKHEAAYIGSGFFFIDGKSYGASVSVSLEQTKEEIALSGSWQDTGDTDSYEFHVELENHDMATS